MKVWEALNAHKCSPELVELVVKYQAKAKMWVAQANLVGGAGGSAIGPVRDYVIESALKGADAMAGHTDPAKLPPGVNPEGAVLPHGPLEATFDRRPKVGDDLWLNPPGSWPVEDLNGGEIRPARVWFVWKGGKLNAERTAVIVAGFARELEDGEPTGAILPFYWLDRDEKAVAAAKERQDAAE